MQHLVDEPLRLKRLLRAARARAPGVDFLLKRAAADLSDRLAIIDRSFLAPVTLYGRAPDIADAMSASGRVGAPVLRIEQHEALLGASPGMIAAEPSALAFEQQSADLIVCIHAMHGIDDIPGLLARIRRALRPDGLFVAAMPAAGTLGELRDSLLAAEAETGAASPRVMPFVDVRQAGDLLRQSGFALPVADVETVTVRYRAMAALMADLRAMGETNALVARSRTPATRALFDRAAAHYARNHADADGRLRATFSTVWMSGWAPHESQQKPLKPGSAEVSLARALRGGT